MNINTVLINTATHEAIVISGQRNIRIGSAVKRLGFVADRITDRVDEAIADYGATVKATYTEQSPELQGLWFNSYN